MRFQWSISLPSRGAFHRSLAVLCAIGRHRYLALEGGPPSFPRATSFPVVLAHPDDGAHAFDYGALTPCGRPFQVLRLACAHSSGPRQRAAPDRTTPAAHRLPAVSTPRVWAAPRSLATTRGIMSVPRGTEMFQFPHLPPPRLCVQRGVTDHDVRRVAPFGHRRRIACLRPTVAFRSLPRPSSARVA